MASRAALRLCTILVVGAVLLAGTVAALAASGASVVHSVDAEVVVPDLEAAAQLPPARTTSIVAADGSRLAGFRPSELHDPIDPDAIPPAVRAAVLAAEDSAFEEHHGVDLAGVARAALVNVDVGAVTQGGSTITQQLVKNLFTDGSDTLERKLYEAHLAMVLEDHYTKDELLAAYLNTTFFGEGAVGIGAAARTYFRVDAADLTLAQAALLAGVIPAPTAYNPRTDPELAETRRQLVLDRVLEEGFASEAEVVAARRDVPVVHPRRGEEARHPYFVDYVRRWLLDVAGFDPALVFGGGLRVETTLDPALQAAAEHVVRTRLPEEGPSGAVVVVDNATGAVRALVGGHDWHRSQVNLALGSLGGGSGRQPGSSFKPFVLAALLQQGFHPNLEVDAPAEYLPGDSDRLVHNYDGRDAGEVTLAEAMRRSINTAYVQAAELADPDRVAELARALGVHVPEDVGSAVALGRYEVSPLEMAAGYAAFARDGVPVHPSPVQRVLDRDGNVLYDLAATEALPPVLTPEAARTVTATLEGVVESGTGTRARLDRPVAGKTGTTDAYTNAWFVGYTARFTAAVWVGHESGNVPMRDVAGFASVSGGTLPASIWHDVATWAVLISGAPPVGFPAAPAPPPPEPLFGTTTTSTERPSTTSTEAPSTTARPDPTTTALTPSTTEPPPETTTTEPPLTTPTIPTTTTTEPPPDDTTTTTTEPPPDDTTTTTTEPPPEDTTTTTQPPPDETTTTTQPPPSTTTTEATTSTSAGE